MPTPTKKSPLDQLDDLTPVERDQLRRALNGESINADAEARAVARLRALAELMDPRDHYRHCPMIVSRTPRVEAFGAVAPPDEKLRLPQRPVTVVRCMECGGQVKLEEAYAVVSRRIEGQLVAADSGR